MGIQFKFAQEEELPISITIELHKLSRLIDLLTPIAEDEDNPGQYAASQLLPELVRVRRLACEQTITMVERYSKRED